MSIQSVTLVLRLGAVGDTAFVYIERYDDSPDGTRTETIAEIAVSLPAIREALQLLRHDVEREDARPPDGDNGEFGAKLAGPRASVLPL